MRARKAKGQTLIHCDTYTVRRNDHYRITGGYEVKVCWIYNEAVSEWSDALQEEPRRVVEGLRCFPHYRTFFQNAPRVIDLRVEEVNALAHLSCWNVTSNERTIREHFEL